MRVLARTARVEVAPVAAVAAAVSAQEALKAVSGTLHPNAQWFYHDACDCLPEWEHAPSVPISPKSPAGRARGGWPRLDPHAELFGARMQVRAAGGWMVGGGVASCACSGADGKRAREY